jgi:hypothetical protein
MHNSCLKGSGRVWDGLEIFKKTIFSILACFIPDALLRCSSEKQKQKCLVLLLVDGIKSLAFKKTIF